MLNQPLQQQRNKTWIKFERNQKTMQKNKAPGFEIQKLIQTNKDLELQMKKPIFNQPSQKQIKIWNKLERSQKTMAKNKAQGFEHSIKKINKPTINQPLA